MFLLFVSVSLFPWVLCSWSKLMCMFALEKRKFSFSIYYISRSSFILCMYIGYICWTLYLCLCLCSSLCIVFVWNQLYMVCVSFPYAWIFMCMCLGLAKKMCRSRYGLHLRLVEVFYKFWKTVQYNTMYGHITKFWCHIINSHYTDLTF